MSSLGTADGRIALLAATASGMLMLFASVIAVRPITFVALLLVLGIACLSPTGVLCGAIASLPYFYRPLDIAGLHFATSEVLLISAVFGTALRLVTTVVNDRTFTIPDLIRQSRAVLQSPLVLAASLLVGLGTILVVFPFDPSHRADSLREWRWTLAEPLVLVGLLVWHRRHQWLPELAALALLVGGAVASFHALADLALGGGVTVGGVTRIAGPYPHPNALALMTIRIAVLAFVWAVFVPRTRRWTVPLLVVCALAVAASFSRGAMLAGLVAVALVLMHATPRIRLFGAGSIMLTLSIAVVAARDRMLDLFGGGSGSLRIDIWSSALAMIDDRPVMGYGPDQFLYAYLPRYVQPTAWSERFTSHAHNFLLDFWIRLGIIGAAFAVFVVLICLIALARRVRTDTQRETLAMAALIALVATFAHGLVDNAYFSHDLAMSCWLLAWLAFWTSPDVAGTEREGRIARTGIGRGRLHRLTPMR